MVTKDIPFSKVAAGVPARVIKSIVDYAEKASSSEGALATKGLKAEEKRQKSASFAPSGLIDVQRV